jgi:putative copper resistance protein D
VDRVDCRTFVQALSTIATGALALVLATGAVNAWSGLAAGSSSALLGSAWTVILLVKLALVGLAVALGGHNRLFGLPKLMADPLGDEFAKSRSFHAFARVIFVEALVLLAVEVAAAALSTSAPPSAA